MSIQEAFLQVCKDAKPAAKVYVSLYSDVPWYGGPEEGGWWGKTVSLAAHQEFDDLSAAEAAGVEVAKLAAELSKEAKREFGQYCRDSLEAAEAKGLFAEDLPEVDGEASYFVVVEEQLGSHNYESSHYYE